MNDIFQNADEWEAADDLGPGWRRDPSGLAFFSSDWLDDEPPERLTTPLSPVTLVSDLPAPGQIAEPVMLIHTIGRPDGMTTDEARHHARVQASTRYPLGDLSGAEAVRRAEPRDATGRPIDTAAMLDDPELRHAELATADAARALIRKLERLREVYRERGRREAGLSTAIVSTAGLEDSLR